VSDLFYESDADPAVARRERLAVVGYGNQGRSWALNLRDSGCDVRVCVRADETAERARQDGFAVAGLDAAEDATAICVLVPDDAIPGLGLKGGPDTLTVLASGYALAYERYAPDGDVGMIAPRMLGPEVRRCYEEGVGFISAIGVHHDATGRATDRLLSIASAIGALRQGALALTPAQEAFLDLAVEQILSPALTHVNGAFVATMLERGIPIEAVLTELFLSGEVERNYRLLREEGFVRQLDYHSPASQYGQLSRRGAFDDLDFAPTMKRLADDIASGRFADEWDAESRAGAPRLEALRAQHAGPAIRAFEEDVRRRLGPAVAARRREGPRED
jgi:ketol-acid reductoisomerase